MDYKIGPDTRDQYMTRKEFSDWFRDLNKKGRK